MKIIGRLALTAVAAAGLIVPLASPPTG